MSHLFSLNKYYRQLAKRAGFAMWLIASGLVALTANSWAQTATPSLQLNAQHVGGGLPSGAQPMISATLGQDDPRYHIQATGTALRLENRSQAFHADFTKNGLEVNAEGGHWGLALREYGYKGHLEQAAEAAPEGSGNRVEFQRGGLVEWYENGPLGLEQGFTLREQPPGKKNGEPLTVGLALTGDLTAATGAAHPTALILNNRSGHGVLRYTGLIAYDASGRELPAWFEVGNRQITLRVDDSGARYPLVIDPFIQQAKLTASDASLGAQLGIGVAISADGNTIVAGAWGDKAYRGAAYVFVKPVAGWATSTETAKLTAADGAADADFGIAVSISADGSTIAIGGGDTTAGAPAPGAVYVFVRPGNGWASATQTAKLTASDGAASDLLGYSVAVSGDGLTIAAGARGAKVGANANEGAAYVFVRPANGWITGTETAKLTASDGTAGDDFGDYAQLGMDGNGSTIVVGASAASVGANITEGAAYVFVRPANGWATATETAKLTASDGTAGTSFGTSVAVSQDSSTVAISAPGNLGAAYVFIKPASGWATGGVETAKLTGSDSKSVDNFGTCIATDANGGIIVVSAYTATVGSNVGQGAAYVFVKPVGGWTTANETSKLLASDGAAYANFGTSLGISSDGSTIAIGAYSAQIGSIRQAGALYVFHQPVSEPMVTLTPSSVNFGRVRGGSWAYREVTLTNSGNAPLQLASVSISGGNDKDDFYAFSFFCPSTLQPGDSCPILLLFHADSDQSNATAFLVVTDNAPGGSQTAPLRATVVKGSHGD